MFQLVTLQSHFTCNYNYPLTQASNPAQENPQLKSFTMYPYFFYFIWNRGTDQGEKLTGVCATQALSQRYPVQNLPNRVGVPEPHRIGTDQS